LWRKKLLNGFTQSIIGEPWCLLYFFFFFNFSPVFSLQQKRETQN
jgi:hypothetical protein